MAVLKPIFDVEIIFFHYGFAAHSMLHPPTEVVYCIILGIVSLKASKASI